MSLSMSISSVRSALPSVQTAIAAKVKVSMLTSPGDYITTLRTLTRSAKNNITLSALYLGNKGNELDLLQDIEAALKDPLRPNLKVTFVLDHSRAGRGDKGNPSSVMMLSELIDKYYPRCRLMLYQMPQTKGFMQQYLPTQIKEILGVYHCKFSVFDSTAILTGANLSEEYFVSRQDRYVLFSGPGEREMTADDDINDKSGSNSLVEFLSTFVSILDKYCHHLCPGGSIQAPNSSCTDERLQIELNNLSGYCHSSSVGGGGVGGSGRDQSDSSLLMTETLLQPLIQHKAIGINQEEVGILKLLKALCQSKSQTSSLVISSPYPSFSDAFMSSLASYSSCSGGGSSGDDAIGPANIEEPAMDGSKRRRPSISNRKSGNRKSDSSSSSKNLESEPLLSGANCGGGGGGTCINSTYIIIPSHNAHGFAKGTGLKAMVPKLHTSAMLTSMGFFFDHLKKLSNQNRVEDIPSSDIKIKAFEQLNWTYHAKGIWHCDRLANSNHHHNADGGKYTGIKSEFGVSVVCPVSYIGSSNLGARSSARDFELGFVCSTSSSRLQLLFGKECDDLLNKCPNEVGYLSEKGKESMWIRLFANCLRSIL